MTLENIFSPTFKQPLPRMRRRRTNPASNNGGTTKRYRRHEDKQDVTLRIEDLDMDRSVLRRALDLVAEYIRSKDQALTIVAVGGFSNPIVLPRPKITSTFTPVQRTGNTNERVLLDEAVDFARRKNSTFVAANWLSTKGGLRIPLQTQAKVTLEALAQNDVVFSAPGLTVLAAPWKYAFCAKVDRLMQDNRRGYDLSEAVAYLRRHIKRHRGRPIVAKLVMKWSKDYHLHCSRRVLREVRQEYRRRYHKHAIVGCLCNRSQPSCTCYA